MPEPKTEKSTEEVSRERRLLLAYAKVFGTDGKRTEAQQIVWDSLCHMCYEDRPTWNADKAGALSTTKMEVCEGMRTVLINIKDFLRRAVAPEKPKPNVKK